LSSAECGSDGSEEEAAERRRAAAISGSVARPPSCSAWRLHAKRLTHLREVDSDAGTSTCNGNGKGVMIVVVMGRSAEGYPNGSRKSPSDRPIGNPALNLPRSTVDVIPTFAVP